MNDTKFYTDITDKKKNKTIGDNLSFAAREAFKRLRTNLMFSFTADDKCKIIGVTSSSRGEGKSTTSVNLALTLAEAGKQTLLIDADLRLPNIHKLLDLKQSPGLSNFLIGACEGKELFQNSGIHNKLKVITAGDIPPNPTEMLASNRMKNTLDLISEKVDYVIIDLPPVDAVADALIISEIVTGMVVVVRQNYADKHNLDNTIRQLQYHNANILGLVMNCTDIGNKYYKKGYYYQKNNP